MRRSLGNRCERAPGRHRETRGGFIVTDRVVGFAEDHGDVAVIGEGEIGFRDECVQDRARIAVPGRPQFRAEVAVERHQRAGRMRRARGRQRGILGGLAERGGHARDVQQRGVRQQCGPVVSRTAGEGERRPGAVVQHFAGTQAGSGGEEVQAHATVATQHAFDIDAVPAQFAQRGIAERVVGDRADHRRGVPEPCQRHGDVGFRAADPYVEPRRLQQALAARGGEAEQKFAETDDPTGTCGLTRHVTSG